MRSVELAYRASGGCKQTAVSVVPFMRSGLCCELCCFSELQCLLLLHAAPLVVLAATPRDIR